MSVIGQNVNAMVRAGSLMGVLVGHALVGGVCLVAGRSGLEALQRTWLLWGFLIMLVGAGGVMTELALRAQKNSGSERLWWILGWLFVAGSGGGWVWYVVGRPESAYDVLASVLSQGAGVNVDAESGAGFAGLPWLALPYVALLVAYCLALDGYLRRLLEATLPSSRFVPRGLVAARMLVPCLGMLAVGGVLHLATGTRLFVAEPESSGSYATSLVP